ncbi:restriction endonuclease subunit S [Cupriavidus oxalaticus]|uniref:Restriction endonuclease n=1 Tax=Cupriavidus oxalaticus TaxID=96344 RepID=A0A5P3VN98_9BURK|nr:restriction endonuclease subunit S [Cupriavidus oxalaticus]QEZ47475.1 restriction endonuclease [Cupriavidus oxalaticus]
MSNIAEFGGVLGGKTPSKANPGFWRNGTVPWVSPKDMKVFDLDGAEDAIAEQAISGAGMSVLPSNSILMVTRSGILAHSFPVAITSVPVTINQDIKAIRPRSEIFLPRYLAYNLRAHGPLILDACSKAGTTVASVESKALERVPLPLAPLPEQARIADKLDTVLARVDACRDRLDHVGAALKRFHKAVLAAATSGRLTEDWRTGRGAARRSGDAHSIPEDGSFDDVAKVTTELPEAWRWGRLAIGITEASYGTATKSSKAGAMPVLRMGNLQGGRIDWSDLAYSNDDGDNQKYMLAVGDILFNRTNSPELVGKTAIYLGERPAIYAGYLIRVKCNENILNPKYVNFCLNAPYGRAYCWAVKSDGVSQSNINAEKLRSFPVPYCEVEEQEEIVRRVEILLSFADRLEARLAQANAAADRLTPALLAKAFRGELVPQDPNDEPASELLKRLNDDRLRAVKGTKSPRSQRIPASSERDYENTAV